MIYRSLQTTNRLFEWKPSTRKGVVGLYEFFQGGAEKPNPVPTVKEMTTGRAWTASELRRKSFEDLHKIWYVLLKERNLLATMWSEAKRWNKTYDQLWIEAFRERTFKCQKSMARIKHVLSERRVAYEYAIRKDPKLFELDKAPESHWSYRPPTQQEDNRSLRNSRMSNRYNNSRLRKM
ncbi:12074_t:CDS:2 [Funneliformis mosseae]|uniref:Large ribosomal subunit protein uL29m n=1 Tax=Funneliformis mosseae TaxID=27381 RepID=A0A9N8YQ06_FUNMO|nr:12074_t:CDS:2 [Funneliformis mosseae]